MYLSRDFLNRPPESHTCAYCDRTEGVALVHSHTAYPALTLDLWQWLALPDDPEQALPLPPEPNPDLFLCPVCAQQYTQFWDEQWDEYYGAVMG